MYIRKAQFEIKVLLYCVSVVWKYKLVVLTILYSNFLFINVKIVCVLITKWL